MADMGSDLSEDEHGERGAPLVPPAAASYPDKASLMAALQAHGQEHGYNVVVKTSSVPTTKKPGRAAKVWLRCDRGGTYRPRNGLTEATRKRRRTSRLIDCPFLVIGNGSSGVWTVEVVEPQHNHGPVTEHAGPLRSRRVQRGQVAAIPDHWPHDASLSPTTTALVVMDMQNDLCVTGGFLSHQGFDLSATQSRLPQIQAVLHAFRHAGFPVFHTRQGHRPDLSTLSPRDRFRLVHHSAEYGIGSPGPMGRFLIRGEPGHDIVPELGPIDGEPIVDKPGPGAFAHTDFDLLLRVRGIRNLVLAGVTTDDGVSSTVREANDRGYNCVVLQDDHATGQQNLHAGLFASVPTEGSGLGTTATTNSLIAALENSRATTARSETRGEEGSMGSATQSPLCSASPLPPALTMPSSSSAHANAATHPTPIFSPISSASARDNLEAR